MNKLLILLRSVVMMYKKLLTIYLVVFHVLSIYCYHYIVDTVRGRSYVLDSSLYIDMGISRGEKAK